MTLDQAFEILSQSADRGMNTFKQDFNDAEKMGIEALKRVREARNYSRNWSTAYLPGETEE